MNNAVKTIEHDEHLPAPAEIVTPMAMIASAVERGMSPEVIGQLMDLERRWRADQGRRAFDVAIAAAKAEIPVITKNRTVDFTSAKGRTHYQYEDLAEVVRTVVPVLAKHGLSHRFRTTSEPNQPVTVTCVLSHRDGYFEENSLTAGRDDSGNKNAIQAIGSTLTYLQRMTLKAALGLAAAEDDDGKAAGGSDPSIITEAQRDALLALIDATKTDVAKFCAAYKIEAVADLPTSRFSDAEAALSRKQQAIKMKDPV